VEEEVEVLQYLEIHEEEQETHHQLAHHKEIQVELEDQEQEQILLVEEVEVEELVEQDLLVLHQDLVQEQQQEERVELVGCVFNRYRRTLPRWLHDLLR
jgi:hypothetical protein